MGEDEVRAKGIKKEVLEYLLSNDYYQNPAEDPNLSDDLSANKCPLSKLCDEKSWGLFEPSEIKDAVDELTANEEVIECEIKDEPLVSIPDYQDAVSMYELYEEDLH